MEYLFNEINHYLNGSSVWDCRSAMNAFLATLSVLCRPELKTDLMKDRFNKAYFSKPFLCFDRVGGFFTLNL